VKRRKGKGKEERKREGVKSNRERERR